MLQEVCTISNEFGGLKKKRIFVSKEKRISELGREAREKYAHIYSNKENENSSQSQNMIPPDSYDEIHLFGGDCTGNEIIVETETDIPLQIDRISPEKPDSGNYLIYYPYKSMYLSLMLSHFCSASRKDSHKWKPD